METRGKSNVYLLGAYESEIIGAKLPSVRQAFGYLLHLHKGQKMTVHDACRETVQKVNTFWLKAGIPVRAKQHCIQKLETIFTEWRGLQKHKSRIIPSQKTKECAFLARLDDLFDIAHADALSIITIPEDRAFLLSQRQKGRPGSIGSVDKVHELQSQKAEQRADRELKRRQKSNQDMESLASHVVLTTDSSSGEETRDRDRPGHRSFCKFFYTSQFCTQKSQNKHSITRCRCCTRSYTIVIKECRICPQ